ncbi:hypothetical protein GOB91_13070 [Sinorhizobium meliloti]|nr:hypothetical protein [Sinorhizobium meliloti]MCO6423816.1 hypothetical protein [Sinorhizobium meliloti]MDW9409507.1 hypothetical protein [Sinorhizobium meliloti]MDW9440867.1 hypothetical protein [Sinorhizobium meliloti]MDW9455031.1 hypothetical protein [Sinorhizobium meliloti]MDW9467245.1 hypothetical protein [Sinorhizobium meliloti]
MDTRAGRYFRWLLWNTCIAALTAARAIGQTSACKRCNNSRGERDW